MTRKPMNIHLATAAFFLLSLYLWRLFYPSTDWAVLAIFPLSIMLFWGYWSLRIAIYRAKLRVAIRAESRLTGILSGKILTCLRAIIFVLISIALLAWQALESSHLEILISIVLYLFAAILFVYLRSRSLTHFHQPFANAVAMSCSMWIIVIAFIPIIAYINWHYVPYSGEFRSASLTEAMRLGIENLPPRRGWIAEVLAPMYAADGAKLWLVVQFDTSRWVGMLYSLDTAIVSFILARVSMILTLLARSLNDKEDIT